MNWVTKLSKNFLALFIGIIIAFTLSEGILRIYNPFDFRVKGDKIILPVNKKYVIKKDRSQKKHSKFDETIIHTKNSLGFRGEEPPANFSEYLTIITVGGSTTECTFLSDGKTWTDQLGKKLKTNFKDIWINNAGFDGHSTFGHLVLMEDYIVKLKPDIVLFLLGANEQGGEVNEQDEAIMRTKYVFSSPKAFLKSLANHSEVFSLALNAYRYWKAVSIGVEHAELDFENYYKDIDLNYYLADETIKLDKENLEITRIIAKGLESRLENLIKISKDNNIEPILITQPTLSGDVIDDVTNVNFSFTKISWQILEILNDATRRVGEKNNVLVIDLAREMPKSSRYYYDWLHYTNEGAEKVAEIIYNNTLNYIAEKYSSYLRVPSKEKKENTHE